MFSSIILLFPISNNMETEKYLCEDNLGGKNLGGIMCEREVLNETGNLLAGIAVLNAVAGFLMVFISMLYLPYWRDI